MDTSLSIENGAGEVLVTESNGGLLGASIDTGIKVRENSKIAKFIFALILVGLISLFFLMVYPRLIGVRSLIDKATTTSEFKVSSYIIYDNSTEDYCNRLIVVEPFKWYILNHGTSLRVLALERHIRCGSGTIPAVNISPDSRFTSVCIPGSMLDILNEYRKYQRYEVPYTLPEPNPDNKRTTFTIFSAIRDLSERKLINIDVVGFNKYPPIKIVTK